MANLRLTGRIVFVIVIVYQNVSVLVSVVTAETSHSLVLVVVVNSMTT